jgi:murein DD-endopeptidase MepM/ murein hydrolase activator NlpD
MQNISKNQRILAAGISVLVVMLLCVWFLGIKTPAYAVLINGKQQFIVKDRNQVELAIEHISKQLGKDNKKIVLSSKIEYKRVFADRKVLMAENKINPELQKGLKFQTNGAVIVVNGKVIASMQDKTAAESLLQKLKAAYSWVGDNEKLVSSAFSEQVTVKETKVYAGEVLMPREAWNLITTGTASPEKYKIKQGDSIWSIARANDMYVDDILKANNLKEDDLLQLDQEIVLVKSKPYINVVAKVEGTTTEVIPYETKIITDSSVNNIKIKSNGANGKKEIAYSVEKINNRIEKKEVISEKIIEQPKDKVMVKGTRVIQVASRSGSGIGSMAWPVSGYISQYFGRHTGIDIAGSIGSPVQAADNGTVTSAGWDGGYGRCIVINHGNGLSTRYAHLSKISVSPGESVSRGQTIGARGSTGNSTGPHLHFEVMSGGSFVNPLNYLR